MIHIVWIVVALAATAVAIGLRSWLPALGAGLFAGAVFLWIVISVLSPAAPDRTCPRCGKRGLVKIRRGVPGVRCELCSFRDEEMHVAYLDEW